MSDLTINERLRAVEVRQEIAEDNAKTREEKQDQILEKLEAIELQMAQTKSFIGGAMWIGMGMVTVLYKLGPWLIGFFKTKTG